jgi:hypothetical protein
MLYCGLNFACQSYHNESAKSNRKDSNSQMETKSDSIDSLFKIEIKAANTRFEISDSQAIVIVRQVNDLREIIDWKYKNDSTIFNKACIDGIPNDTYPNWTINIRQEQPRIDQSTSLMFLIVNANSGKIHIWNVPQDTLLTIDEWRKRKNN